MDRFSDETLSRLAARLTLEEKVLLLTGRDSWSLHPLPSIGLRSITVSDGPAGVRGDVWDERSPSANFPSPTSLASTWDRAAVRKVGRGLGSEARRKNVDVVLAPTINLHRAPYGGRHFEAFSEDPVLTAELAGEYVAGVQEYGVAATLKHYIANEFETDRFTVDVQVDERTLRELYLLAFEGPVVDAGAWVVMSSYNSINGDTASENRLLTTPLNDEWGFDGVVVSDWTAVRSLESARHPQDLAMPGPRSAWGDALVAAVRAGSVPEEAIDRKVVRILRLAARVGALDGVASAVPNPPTPAEVRTIAHDVAISGSVLLKNDGALPLTGTPSIALIGEGATDARTQGGGSATVIPELVMSPADGLRTRFGNAAVSWARGAVVDRRPSPLPLTDYLDDTGAPGMTVTYLDADGDAILREHRATSIIVSFDAESLSSRSSTIELSFTYRNGAGSTGVPFAVIGVCDFEITVDGVSVAAGEIRTRDGDDPATAVLTPPFASLTLPVHVEGSDVVVRLTPFDGGIPDASAFGIGIPAPVLDADQLIAEATELAAEQDVAIVVVSTSAEVESEGFDRQTLGLPGRQDDLVRAVAAANPRTIVVVNAGAPVLLPWLDDVAAILTVWFPGQEFGTALAAIISGDAEPGGRLPTTWPDSEENLPVGKVTPVDGRVSYTEGLHIGYRGWLELDRDPAFPFGYGLGYTTWDIEAVDAPEHSGRQNDLEVTAVVRNTGTRVGKAVAQFYLERSSPSVVERPERWLAAFETIEVAAGESQLVTATIPWRRFAHWNEGWVVEPGEYRLIAGTNVLDEGACASFTIA